MKTLLSFVTLTVYFSTLAQVAAADGLGNNNYKVCKSSDPALSAKEIECYPENNLMIIHEPRYTYNDKTVALVEHISTSVGDTKMRNLCFTFGSEKRAEVIDRELSDFFMYGKSAVDYYNKDYVLSKKQSPKHAPLSSVSCKLYQEGHRIFKSDDGILGCYEINLGKRGSKIDDRNCVYGTEIIKLGNGVSKCFTTYLSDSNKEVPFGKSVDMSRCEVKPITDRVQADNLP